MRIPEGGRFDYSRDIIFINHVSYNTHAVIPASRFITSRQKTSTFKHYLLTLSYHLCWEGKEIRSPFPPTGNHNTWCHWKNNLTPQSTWFDLISVPTVLSNGATFSVKNHTDFEGPLDLKGIMETNSFKLKSSIPSQLNSGSLKVETDMDLNGTLQLLRPVGSLIAETRRSDPNLRYHMPMQELVCGKGSSCHVGENLTSSSQGEVLNLGSTLHYHLISPKVKEVFQIISNSGINLSAQPNHPLIPKNQKETFVGSPVHNCATHGETEHCLFNNKSIKQYTYVPLWDQNIEFKPSPTTGSIMTISPTNGQVNYSITAPILFVQYAGDLVLGASQAGKPTPKPQSVSLMELKFNGHLVQYNNRQIEVPTHSPCSTPFQFMFRPKFWYDDKQAQSFYKDILDYAFVMHNDGFEKLKKGCLLSLTPDLLIEKVREACQKTLNRPYLEISMNSEENKITEKVVRQLHLNMFEYLKEQGEKALLWQDLKHPVLYYVGLQNQFGQCEFSPHIRFPQKMIDQANGTQIGTNIVGNFMAVLPAGMSLQDFLGICQMHPPILKYVTNLLETNPRVANGMLKALESVTPEPVSQDIVPVNSSSTLARTSPENNLTIHGNVNMETAVAISKNDLVIDGDIQGINGLFAALHDLWIISRKERRSFHENGWYGFKDVLTVKAAINMIKNLTLTSGRHTTSVGAYTRGGESQPINTGGQFRPQPLILEMEANRNSHGKNWAREEHKSSSTPVPSSHYGYHLPITTGEGVNGNGVELGGNTAVIIAENNDIRLNPAIKTDSYSSHTSSTDDGIFFSSTDHHYHNSFTSTSIPSTLNFPGGIHAITNGKEDKLELEHTDFNTVQGTIAESYNISIRPGTERQEISNHSISSDFFRTTVEGNNTRIVRHPSGIITGPFTPRTPSGDRSRNPRVSITTVAGEETPEYLKALRLLKNIELIESTVRDEHHYNSYSHSYLSP